MIFSISSPTSVNRKVADRIVFMADGQIIEEGTPEHFFEDAQTPRVQQFLGKILKH